MSRSKGRDGGRPRRPNARRGRDGRGPGSRDDWPGPPGGAHLVPGERAITELLRSQPGRVARVLVEEGRSMPAVTELGREKGVSIETCERGMLDAWVGEGLARGAVAVAQPPREWDIEELLDPGLQRQTRSGRRLLVALDGLQDPHNLGAIVRSAEFFGAVGLVQTRDRAAPLSPVAVRASAGASERLPLGRVTNLRRALERCKEAGFWVVGTVVEDGQPWRELLASDLPESLVLVLGSEQKGLRPLTRKVCDFLATIEGVGGLGSLNVASAAAIAIAMLAQRAE